MKWFKRNKQKFSIEVIDPRRTKRYDHTISEMPINTQFVFRLDAYRTVRITRLK